MFKKRKQRTSLQQLTETLQELPPLDETSHIKPPINTIGHQWSPPSRGDKVEIFSKKKKGRPKAKEIELIDTTKLLSI